MREIKFRGKDILNGEWIKGYLFYDYNNADEYRPFITYKSEAFLGGVNEQQIDKDTIGQYTGLKDKNGKEIYEGDVLQDKDCIYKVIFEYGSFDGKIIEVLRNVGTQKGMTYQLSFIISDNDNIKVIGNIYENPELLEENK